MPQHHSFLSYNHERPTLEYPNILAHVFQSMPTFHGYSSVMLLSTCIVWWRIWYIQIPDVRSGERITVHLQYYFYILSNRTIAVVSSAVTLPTLACVSLFVSLAPSLCLSAHAARRTPISTLSTFHTPCTNLQPSQIIYVTVHPYYLYLFSCRLRGSSTSLSP